MGRVRNVILIAEKANPILLMFFTPSYFAFMMTNIRGPLVEYYQMGPLKHGFHIFMSSWCFFNIVGNMIMGITTNTTLRRSAKGEKYCDECKMSRPTKSWHCYRCNVCILRRDHHCYFFSRCIGLYNLRYFINYLLHVFTSMLYSTYYIYLYVSLLIDKRSTFLYVVLRITNPIFRYYRNESLGYKDLYVTFLLLNTALIVWSATLLSFHLKNMLMGETAHDRRPLDWTEVRTNWRENTERVFGKNWYLTVLCPFFSSPLPENVNKYNN